MQANRDRLNQNVMRPEIKRTFLLVSFDARNVKTARGRNKTTICAAFNKAFSGVAISISVFPRDSTCVFCSTRPSQAMQVMINTAIQIQSSALQLSLTFFINRPPLSKAINDPTKTSQAVGLSDADNPCFLANGPDGQAEDQQAEGHVTDFHPNGKGGEQTADNIEQIRTDGKA